MLKQNDVVLCINDKSLPGHGPVVDIKEGSSYTIQDLFLCKCSSRVTLKEVRNAILTAMNTCPRCNGMGISGFYSWRFIKIAGDDINTEDTKEKWMDLPVQKTGFITALKRLKEKILA